MMNKNCLEVLTFGIAAIVVAVIVLNVALPIQEGSRLIAHNEHATDRSMFE